CGHHIGPHAFPPRRSSDLARMRFPALLLAVLLALPASAAEPAVDAPRTPGTLQPGEFLWHPEIAPHGPIVLVVSLDEQRAYVYRSEEHTSELQSRENLVCR